jgi:ankyrin repeat protein
LEANPDAVCHANLFGRTPLHLACMELNNNSTTAPARAQSAMLLLQPSAARTAVRLEDHHGCTALHYLLTNSSNSIPRELMQTILDLDACALERRNNHGQSPLDVFAAFQQDDTVTRVRADDQKLDICQVLRIISTTSTSVDIVVGH